MPITLEFDADDLVEEFSHCFTGECRVGVLPVLYKINQVIAGSADLADSLAIILGVMQDQLKMQRGMVTLHDRQAGTIFIHASFGLSEEEKSRGAYVPGEGITGKVIQSGKAIIVPHLLEDPDFHDRRGASGVTAGKERKGARTAFYCVPIMHAQKVLGTISGERVYRNQRLLRQDVELLAMIALMIAPVVELYLIENVDKVRLENENRRLKNALKERFRPANIIGSSKPMLEVYELIRKVCDVRTTVMILGESGVGKELVANAVHYNGPNAEHPFVAINCAALPESLAESELFGHEKGAFTGAVAQHKGCFEQADGGTIFLDEVGELSPAIQAKLLRILQERTFERIGGNKPLKVDLRVVTATNCDLAAMVEQGKFREDLYYRLNVFPITVPPLRERGSDVITLADHFATMFAKANGKSIKRISTPALNMLMSYHWPGNVRELENVIERSILLSEDNAIHSYDLPPSLQTSKASGTAIGVSLESKLRAVEYEMIVDALKNSNGHIGDAARELGLTRRMLGFRMERYGIVYKTFRSAEPSR